MFSILPGVFNLNPDLISVSCPTSQVPGVYIGAYINLRTLPYSEGTCFLRHTRPGDRLYTHSRVMTWCTLNSEFGASRLLIRTYALIVKYLPMLLDIIDEERTDLNCMAKVCHFAMVNLFLYSLVLTKSVTSISPSWWPTCDYEDLYDRPMAVGYSHSLGQMWTHLLVAHDAWESTKYDLRGCFGREVPVFAFGRASSQATPTTSSVR